MEVDVVSLQDISYRSRARTGHRRCSVAGSSVSGPYRLLESMFQDLFYLKMGAIVQLLMSRPPESMVAEEDTDADAAEHGAQICCSFGSLHFGKEFVWLFLRQSNKSPTLRNNYCRT